MNNLSFEIVDVTPETAKRWLSLNTHNRSFKKHSLEKLVYAIETKQWLNTGDSIKFNGDGQLLDGQHRLMAVVKTKKTTPIFIQRYQNIS